VHASLQARALFRVVQHTGDAFSPRAFTLRVDARAALASRARDLFMLFSDVRRTVVGGFDAVAASVRDAVVGSQIAFLKDELQAIRHAAQGALMILAVSVLLGALCVIALSDCVKTLTRDGATAEDVVAEAVLGVGLALVTLRMGVKYSRRWCGHSARARMTARSIAQLEQGFKRAAVPARSPSALFAKPDGTVDVSADRSTVHVNPLGLSAGGSGGAPPASPQRPVSSSGRALSARVMPDAAPALDSHSLQT
jgi:hypothetical protein